MKDNCFKNDRDRLKHYERYALKRGSDNQDAEDFAQEAFLRYFEAGTEIKLIYVYADFIRALCGRTGTERSVGTANTRSLDATYETEGGPGCSLHERIGSSRGDPESEILDRRYDELYRKAHLWNGASYQFKKRYIKNSAYSLIDFEVEQQICVSHILGLTESRISQIKRSIDKQAQKELILKTKYIDYKNDPESSKLMVNWITI